MKVIDLLNKIAKGEEAPKKIKWEDTIYGYSDCDKDYLEFPFSEEEYRGLFDMKDSVLIQYLNDEVEILDDEEDKDIPLISDDELWNIEHINLCGVDRNNAIDYNLKVLKEKINQVVEEMNRRNNASSK